MLSNLEIKKLLKDLESWFDMNGFAGFDPYDIKGHPTLIGMQKHTFPRKIFNLFVEMFPGMSRQIFQIRPEINAKAMALLTLAQLNRFETTSDPEFLNNAVKTGTWLIQNGEEWKKGIVGWGYPFDWQSRVLIPRDTPSSVVTTFGLQALVALHKYRPELIPPTYFEKIGRFFMEQLNRSQDGCFSYTPVDDFQVHNANLFSALSLIILSKLTQRAEYFDAAVKSADYTVSQQGENGQFGYWGNENHQTIVDHFHTGYVIRALSRINSMINKPEYEAVLEKAMSYYITDLFVEDFPKDRNNRLFPIDIHTLSEVILVYCELPNYRRQLSKKLEKTLNFMVHKMQYKPGCYAQKKYPLFKINFPFLRWNQAWVYYALTELEKISL